MEAEQLIEAAKRIASAAARQELATIPQSELTNEVLTFEYSDGKTPLFIIAITGQLQFVPNPFLCEENVTRRVFRDSTVLHAAAIAGQLNLIPAEILTSRNLLMVDKSEETPLLNALRTGHLDQIPVAVLSENRNLRFGSKTLLEQLPMWLQAAVKACPQTSGLSAQKLIRILLVDEFSAPVKCIVQDVLVNEHTFTESTNGIEALGKLGQEQFDLVITALDLAGIRGDALAAEIKKKSPSTPVILTTSRDVGSADCSADVILKVPWRIAELTDAIRKLLPRTTIRSGSQPG